MAGAAVQGLSEDEVANLGNTDADGELRVDVDGTGHDEILASAPGFVTGSARPRGELAETVAIALRPAGEISGRVELQDGTPVGAGVDVLAWQEGDYPAQSLAIRALNGDLRAIVARTGEEGDFVLHGLDPDRQYSAIAAGRGYVSPSFVGRVRCGMPDLRIVVRRAYAAWVRLREEGGLPLRTSRSLYGRRFGGPRSQGGWIDHISGFLPQVALLLGSVSRNSATLADRFYVFTSAGNEPDLGPIDMALDYPGYEPKTATFRVPALEEDGPADITIELRPSAPEWGALDIRFSWLLSGYAPVDEAEPFGLLSLVDETGRSCEFAVREAFPASVDVEGLPAGKYQWEFQTMAGEFRAPDPTGTSEVQIGPESSHIEVDLSELGAVHLGLFHPDESEYRRAANIKVQREGGPDLPARILRAPPYVVSGLLPGVYEVWVDEPRFLDQSRETARVFGTTILVEPERVSRANVYLPE